MTAFDDLSVVTSTACPKGKAFLMGPPDEDEKREVVAIINLVKEKRSSRLRRFFGADVSVARWMWWLLLAGAFANTIRLILAVSGV